MAAISRVVAVGGKPGIAVRRIRPVMSLRKWAIRFEPMRRLLARAGDGSESRARRVDSIVLAAKTTAQESESSGGRKNCC